MELLVALVLLSIFFGAGYESVIAGLRTTHAAEARETLRQQLANTLELFAREAAVADKVKEADDQQFTFDADLNGDGHVEHEIEYRVQNGALQRTFKNTTITLVDSLAGLTFAYTDVSGAAVPTPVKEKKDLRVVELTISATKEHETLSMASAVYLRNNQ